MKKILGITKKELTGYLFSPIAFIFIVIFLISQMGFTFILGRFYNSNNASLDIFFTFQPWLYLFLVPAIGMRLWAEEKREGTIEFLCTLPIKLPHLIIGKFLASWLFILIALLLTFPIIFTVFFLGSPDIGPILTGYFISWLMAGAYLAITCFTSALTKNQVISFVLSVIICFALVLSGYGVFQQYLSFLPHSFVEFLSNFGFIPHFTKAMRGVLDIRDIIYFLSMLVFFLVLNISILDSHKTLATGKRKNLINATNILILFFALFSINFIFSKTNLKLDLTEDSLYTLSDGSRKIVSSIDEEVTIKYFFSSSDETLPIMVKNYGKRVKEVLDEFSSYSSNLSVEEYDPKPDSDEEELATRYGIYGVHAENGAPFYMGAAVLYQDEIFKIPFFDPRKEEFLEYDIASMLAKMKPSSGDKTLGILSSFKLSSPRLPPRMNNQPPQQEAWLFKQELEKMFDVEELDSKIEEIPSKINTLLVLHPQNLSEQTQYAIEQYILKGGKAVLAVDPSAKSIPSAKSPYAAYGMQNTTSSDAKNIFKMLEIEYDPSKVIVDENHATRVNSGGGILRYPFWLSLGEESFNSDMVLTAQLKSALFVETGFFKLKSGSNFTYTSLIDSSSNSGTINKQQLSFISPQNFGNYDKLYKALSISGVVKGKFKSTFKKKPEKTKYSQAHVGEAEKENSVLLIGDIDFLNNRFSLKQLNFFGQTMLQPINQNIVYLSNALEFISGSPELISIRSRGKFSRPFEKVREIERKAQARWFNVEKELTAKIQQLQSKLNSLQSAKTKDNQLVLSTAQQEEIRKFKTEQMKFKRKRREVRKNLRQDIEFLGSMLTILNMTIIPFIILVAGLYIYVKRSRGESLFFQRSRSNA